MIAVQGFDNGVHSHIEISANSQSISFRRCEILKDMKWQDFYQS